MTIKAVTVDTEALTLPAAHVNRFQITGVDGTLVRLSFAETLGTNQASYRSAVIMSANNARELALSILNALGTKVARPS